MKKILIILSAALLSACSNYGHVRHEQSYVTVSASSASNASSIIFIQRESPRLYPYYIQRDYRYENYHNRPNKPNRPHHDKPSHDKDKPNREPHRVPFRDK